MMSGIEAAWREVKIIVIALMGLELLALWYRKWLVMIMSTTLLGWVIYFFRNPDRQPDSLMSNAILAPADGKIMSIELVNEPYFIFGQTQRISIFLSLFDVHVQRSPEAGTIELLYYRQGTFAPAFMSHSDTNEFNLMGLQTDHGPVVIKQMAGILARRIICWHDIGDQLIKGERFGLIRFGSRVDLFLPTNVEILVEVGQQLYGGQTTVATWQK